MCLVETGEDDLYRAETVVGVALQRMFLRFAGDEQHGFEMCAGRIHATRMAVEGGQIDQCLAFAEPVPDLARLCPRNQLLMSPGG